MFSAELGFLRILATLFSAQAWARAHRAELKNTMARPWRSAGAPVAPCSRAGGRVGAPRWLWGGDCDAGSTTWMEGRGRRAACSRGGRPRARRNRPRGAARRIASATGPQTRGVTLRCRGAAARDDPYPPPRLGRQSLRRRSKLILIKYIKEKNVRDK